MFCEDLQAARQSEAAARVHKVFFIIKMLFDGVGLFGLDEIHGGADIDLIETEAFGAGFDDVDGLCVEGESLKGERVDEDIVAAAIVGKVGVLRIEGDAVSLDKRNMLACGAVADVDILIDG